jgi:hypothetical protein
MELQRKESKEFLDDLTTRDQRMMFAVLTMVLTADSKKQLDADTETILSVARKKYVSDGGFEVPAAGRAEYCPSHRGTEE